MSTEDSPYEHLLHVLERNSRAQTEVVSGKRIGFYRLKETLGTGSFYQVKRGVHLLTSENVVVKIINRTKLLAEYRHVLSQEISCIMKLEHCNIIRLFEVHESFLRLCLFMEYASEGDLHSRVLLDGPFSEQRAKEVFVQVVAGVTYMHCNKVIHRDLRPENVFYITDSHIKIGDFGLGIPQTEEAPHTFCGSLPYAAPELLGDNCSIGPSVDVWAMGVMLYYMLTGNTPFAGDEVAVMKEKILCGCYTQPMVSPACQDVIAMLLITNAPERPSAADMLGSKWLEGQQGVSEFPKPHQPPPQPDSEVVECMRRFGVPKTNTSELLGESYSAVTGIYRILLHQKLIECTAEQLHHQYSQPSIYTDVASSTGTHCGSPQKLSSVDECSLLGESLPRNSTVHTVLTETTGISTPYRVRRLKSRIFDCKTTVCRKIKSCICAM